VSPVKESEDPDSSRAWLFSFDHACIDPRLRGAIADPEEVAELVRVPAFGIRVFPLFVPEFCRDMIWLADLIDCFEPDPDDPYPGREFGMDQVQPLSRVLVAAFACYIKPVVSICFDSFDVDEVVDSFILRYTMDTQRDMGAHFDEQSEVSMCVALNGEFEGPGLRFPRYEFQTAGNVEVGEGLLFPGRVTHLHEVPPITSGRRYSQTWWMKGKGI